MMNKMTFDAAAKALDKENFVSEHAISTDSLDRDGEVVVFDDLDAATANYRRNPIVLFYHNLDPATPKLPVGKNLELRRDGGRIIGRTQFAVREDETNFTRTLWNLHVGGYLNGVSIGFRPGKIENVGTGENMKRVVHVEQLNEYSLVPVPANPDALTLMAKALSAYKHGPNEARVVSFATIEASIKALRAEVEQHKGTPPDGETVARLAELHKDLHSCLGLADYNKALVDTIRRLTGTLKGVIER